MTPSPLPSLPGRPRKERGPRPALPLALLLVLVAGFVALLPACDGTNIFSGEVVEFEPEEQDDDDATVNGGGFFDFVAQGTLLETDEERLRFRWADDEELRLQLRSSATHREREAFRRAAEEVADAGGPEIRVVGTRANLVVEAFPGSEYRELDPTRPWSFSRTWVTADRERGITEVSIAVQLDLDDVALERAALHALGHAVGIMGHPAVPGDRHVMAARVPEASLPPTRFTELERKAIRFLYSEGVAPGMTRLELSERAEAWTP